ncbi:MAG TPA: type II toxin-antitoxin system HigB family toxin [Desulfomonilaceae bacterium]|nr:type II toxin-antitoxin system HigB family toxin [Desulfomonilaceae bacterium]
MYNTFMRVYSKSTLRDFWEKHADAEQPLKTWYAVSKAAKWNSTVDLKKHYPDASILSKNRVVFNIKGNDYGLAASIDYDKQRIFIRFVGTHKEYDIIDAKSI